MVDGILSGKLAEIAGVPISAYRPILGLIGGVKDWFDLMACGSAKERCIARAYWAMGVSIWRRWVPSTL